MRTAKPQLERFKEKYVVDSLTGCWLWTGHLTHDGYAKFSADGGRLVYAHRFSYETFVGSIPKGLTLDHTCHNGSGCIAAGNCRHRRCVNWKHVEPVTHQVNLLRGETIAAKNASKIHCPKGHAYDKIHGIKRKRRRCSICNLAKLHRFRSKARWESGPGVSF